MPELASLWFFCVGFRIILQNDSQLIERYVQMMWSRASKSRQAIILCQHFVSSTPNINTFILDSSFSEFWFVKKLLTDIAHRQKLLQKWDAYHTLDIFSTHFEKKKINRLSNLTCKSYWYLFNTDFNFAKRIIKYFPFFRPKIKMFHFLFALKPTSVNNKLFMVNLQFQVIIQKM